MGLLDVFHWGTDDTPGAMYECRDCGKVVLPDVEKCPNCGSTEIACYRF